MAISDDNYFTESDGHQLAIEMLYELRDTNADWLTIESKCREGQAQENVVLRYLDALRKSNSQALDAGFAAILTDFIGMSYDGGATDIDLYERITGTG